MVYFLVPQIPIILSDGRCVYLDAHFTMYLEKKFRAASLIKDHSKITSSSKNGIVLEPNLLPSELGEFVENLVAETNIELSAIPNLFITIAKFLKGKNFICRYRR
ncbi:hypothetical protein [Archaeoglobus neptunius]|uniref:hypothetical protein n=1 Tax=Archaeoglobus neptunius TaxID=2798580 RepID=UPI0019264656|nr:hypothetical protein [Archaeoglobus neptunius]